MTGKRKRGRRGQTEDTRLAEQQPSRDLPVKHALLMLYYAEVLTLREYLLSKLPATSKVRRRKVLSIGHENQRRRANEGDEYSNLAIALDETFVGILELKEREKLETERHQIWTSFSQRRSQDGSRIGETSMLGSSVSQSEIIDCSIFGLFQKSLKTGKRPQHLLCQGYRRHIGQYNIDRGQAATSTIPGIVSVFPNNNVAAIKNAPWPQILALMGKDGEKEMLDLVMHCGIFIAIEGGQGNYHQLSGIPLGDLEVRPNVAQSRSSVAGVPDGIKMLSPAEKANPSSPATPGNITFVRNRMLYARAALNARGNVQFGLRHIHALNRYPYRPSTQGEDVENGELLKTVAITKYIFPRQYGLHNVFTSKVNRQETVHPFKDYTLREHEINDTQRLSGSSIAATDTKIPKRLRGSAIALTEKLRKLHDRCPYYELLKHYCPTSSSLAAPDTQVPIDSTKPDATSQDYETSCVLETPDTSIVEDTQLTVQQNPNACTTETSREIPDTPPPTSSLLDRATSVEAVSAFCRAVFNRLVPNDFWGKGQVQEHNKGKFLASVDSFVKLRRFENLSLHEVVQEMKISEIEWLCPPGLAKSKTSQTDMNKRLEIFHEFIYYLFDSLLIPLIRASLYVTESNVHRYRLFFFRHDVWREFSEPAMATLKAAMFEEIKSDKANDILASRALGFSQIRLLPKAMGVRPIMNLRRRQLKKGSKTTLGYSVNSTLAPVYNMLTYEKNTNPSRLGSTMFSVGDIYQCLKSYKQQPRPPSSKFFFAKVDVQAAFDTIPQSAVIKLMRTLPRSPSYTISKHVEIKPGEGYRLNSKDQPTTKPIRKWTSLAKPINDLSNFHENLLKPQGLASLKKNTVFVENINNITRGTNELLHLLEEHIKRNIVKIGKKFYRQKKGIPQGSVISSLLCNYFYADLESKHLEFLHTEEGADSLLLRLMDDFLLITTNRDHAQRFLGIMHQGLPEYGVSVKSQKTLLNFNTSYQGQSLPRLPATSNFPYCGTLISTSTLEISKDLTRRNDLQVSDSLTVEFSKTPGKTFQRKTLNMFKIQVHAMFLDTNFNSVETVATNIFEASKETAEKMAVYWKCLGRGKRPASQLVEKTVEATGELAFCLVRSKGSRVKGYRCALTKIEVQWLVFKAFLVVLRRKQSSFAEVLKWVEVRILGLEVGGKRGVGCGRVMGFV